MTAPEKLPKYKGTNHPEENLDEQILKQIYVIAGKMFQSRPKWWNN